MAKIKLDRLKTIQGNIAVAYTTIKSAEDKRGELVKQLMLLTPERAADTDKLVPMLGNTLITQAEWVYKLLELRKSNAQRKAAGQNIVTAGEIGLFLRSYDDVLQSDPTLAAQIKNKTFLYVDTWDKNTTAAYNKIVTSGSMDSILGTPGIEEIKNSNRYIEAFAYTQLNDQQFLNIVISSNPSLSITPTFYIIETKTMLYKGKLITEKNKSYVSTVQDSLDIARSQDSIITNFIEKNKVLSVTQVKGDDTVDVGHGVSAKSQDFYAQYEALEKLEAASINDLEQAKKNNNTTAQKDAKELVDLYREFKLVLQTVIDYSDTVDRLVLEISKSFKGPTQVIKNQFQSLLQITFMSGAKDITIFEETNPGQTTARNISIPFALGVSYFLPENRRGNQQGKGRVTLEISDAWKSFLLNKLSAKETIQALVRKVGSSSHLSKLLLISLDKIFNTKEFSKEIIEQKKAKNRIFHMKNPYKARSVDRVYNKLLAALKSSGKTKKQKLNRFKRTSKKVFGKVQSQTTLNIVSLINAEIYKYVRAQMSENTLQYRTGEFARSVRVLSAEENAAVQYTYKKNPYSDVFSPGKSYLATEDRNPAKIIDAAIKRLGQDRFQKVFRTEEV